MAASTQRSMQARIMVPQSPHACTGAAKPPTCGGGFKFAMIASPAQVRDGEGCSAGEGWSLPIMVRSRVSGKYSLDGIIRIPLVAVPVILISADYGYPRHARG